MPAPLGSLGALRSQRPEEWRARVRAALELAGSVPGAALELGVSRDTLERWLAADPSIREGLALPGRGRPTHVDDGS
jgi:hypothetical protein